MIKPIALINSTRKSYAFFKRYRWQKRRHCPICKYSAFWKLKDGRFKCKRCGYKFKDFTGTYLAKLNIPINEICHILYLFVLGVLGYRMRQYIEVSLKTIHKVFTVIRQAIYDEASDELKEANISGKVEMD
ncbi:MAG: transposase, partial [Candidatus Ratteibacteria bacterium]